MQYIQIIAKLLNSLPIITLYVLISLMLFPSNLIHHVPSLILLSSFLPFSFSHSVFKDGQWSVGSVLDSFNIPLLYERILKERRKELIDVADQEKELQLDSLDHDLQITVLQGALHETQSQLGITYTVHLANNQ